MRRVVVGASIFAFLASACPAQDIGDVLQTISFPAVPQVGEQYWAFDNTLGRYYFTGSDDIYVKDRTGAAIKTLDLSGSSNLVAFKGAHGTNNRGAVFVENDDTIHLFKQSAVTTWSLTDNGDGTADVAQTGSIDFTAVLPADCITAIDRAPDDSWWVICSNSIYNISPDGTGIRRTITNPQLFDALFGSTAESYLPHLLGVHPISGELFLYAALNSIEGGVYHFYRLDDVSLLQEGRLFLPPEVLHPANIEQSRISATTDGMLLFSRTENQIFEYSFLPQDLPDITASEFDQKGVMWTFCSQVAEALVTHTLTVDWGEGAGPSTAPLIDVGEALPYSAPIVANGNTIEAGFKRLSLDGHAPNFVNLILLKNDQGQLSTPIPVAMPLSSFSEPVLFIGVCAATFFNETIVNKVVTWSWNAVAPRVPFNAFVEFVDGVPWVGGKRYGIKDVQATGKAELPSEGDGAVAVSGGGSFLVGSGQLRTEFGGGVVQELTTEGPQITGGLVSVKVAGTVTEEAGLIQAFPQLFVLRNAPLIGSAIRWLDTRAKLTAAITVGIDTVSKIKLSSTNDLEFSGEISGFLTLGVAAAVKLLGSYAEVSAFGEGTGAVKMIPNNGTLEFDSFTLSALIGAKIRAYLIERSVQRVFSVSTSQGRIVERNLPGGGVVSDSGWQYAYAGNGSRTVQSPAQTPHVLTANPFSEFESHRRGLKRVRGAASFNTEVAVLGGIPAEATLHSSSDMDGQTMMVVWAQPIEGNPATQATDIWYSYFDGFSFSTPAPVSTDSRLDMNPKTIWHEDDVWVALWERVGLEDLQPSGDAMADNTIAIQNLRPTWSWFDPNTGVWAAP